MPMGVVSQKDFQKEVDNSAVAESETTLPNLPPTRMPEVVDMERPGRKEGDNNVPNGLRKLIGVTSVEEGRAAALQLAEQFGISPSAVSAYQEGATSTATIDEKPNIKTIDDAKKRIAKKASTVLHRALDNLSEDKLAATKAVELAQIAKSMSGIVKDMEPEEGGDKDRNEPIFQVFAPQIHQENHYDTIVVRE
jgi:hypothetical protein